MTYGTFEPRAGFDYPSPGRVALDFALMRDAGVNTVRIYTAPPAYLLDEAERQGLRVIVGLAWSQHICFLDDARLAEGIRAQIRREVESCADHPAVLAFAIGNEIPQQIVRWHGAKKIEKYLKRLCADVKSLAPDKMVTYVNFPPTDYLDLSFLDFVCFNVFLHKETSFKAYISKLQNIAGNRPLVLTELGMDSIREGLDGQARFLDWQLREAYHGGVAGACVFSWTDDWYRGGNQISDWAFGMVDAERNPKPAYQAVKSRFARIPFEDEERRRWPKVSVVICAYNAASTIEDNLESLTRLNYPNYEVIVVNDGSKDATPKIAARYPFKLINVPNGGLSAARNLGWRAATGEIVAYTDSDTRVDPDWLAYLVQPFLTTDAVGVGGPNVAPEDDGWIAQCVARSPGGPTHVLLNDTIAEHIPGCNMAFRRRALDEVGGFDPTYTKAGDDVDICWRLQERGWRLAFSPSALVWHHHRNSVGAYWRQQVGYGEGESFLEHRHQEKFNERGQTRWQGRIYSHLPAYRSLFKSVIYHGRWGAAAFPSVYQGGVDNWTCLPLMLEWQTGALLALFAGLFLRPMLVVATTMFAATLWRCVAHAWQTKLDDAPTADSSSARLRHRLLIAWLHYIQLWARFRGRVKGYFGSDNKMSGGHLLDGAPSLSPGDGLLLLFHRLDATYWDTRYTSIDDFLLSFKRIGEQALAPVRCDDGWQGKYDLRLRACRNCSLNVKLTAEDHGGMKRLFRARIELRRPWRFWAMTVASAALGGYLGYLLGYFWAAPAALFSIIALALVLRQMCKYGGQTLAALEVVAQELKLYSLLKIRAAKEDKNEPVFEEN
ncbi:MAG: glycosyltransferase [Chloracidobacterium sp.]|nr:glycosyltransferase [Chloracidobacterium sp.]